MDPRLDPPTPTPPDDLTAASLNEAALADDDLPDEPPELSEEDLTPQRPLGTGAGYGGGVGGGGGFGGYGEQVGSFGSWAHDGPLEEIAGRSRGRTGLQPDEPAGDEAPPRAAPDDDEP